MDSTNETITTNIQWNGHACTRDLVCSHKGTAQAASNDVIAEEAQGATDSPAVAAEARIDKSGIADLASDTTVGMDVNRHGQLPLLAPVRSDLGAAFPMASERLGNRIIHSEDR